MDPGPRGDAILLAEINKAELSDILKEDKANYKEVLEASRNTAQEVKVLFHAKSQMFTDQIPEPDYKDRRGGGIKEVIDNKNFIRPY